MPRRIRIIEPTRRAPTFSERLENRARELVARTDLEGRTDEITPLVDREMALTLDQLNRTRALHGRLRHSLLVQELYLDTEIMQREPREPVYIDERLPERDRLRDRLRAVDKERRKLAMEEESRLQTLHDRLLSVVNKHHQLQL